MLNSILNLLCRCSKTDNEDKDVVIKDFNCDIDSQSYFNENKIQLSSVHSHLINSETSLSNKSKLRKKSKYSSLTSIDFKRLLNKEDEFVDIEVSDLFSRKSGMINMSKENIDEDHFSSTSLFNMNNFKFSSKIILDIEIQNAMKLYLSEVDGDILNGQVIEIDASGICNNKGRRHARDGFSFFGFEEEINNKKVCIDFILNLPNRNKRSVLFCIFYHRQKGNYFLKNINEKNKEKYILYYKVVKPFKINQKTYFLIGSAIFVSEVLENSDLRITILSNEDNQNK